MRGSSSAGCRPETYGRGAPSDRAGSTDKRLLRLQRCYHVATLDYDKTRIASESIAFMRRRASAAAEAD